LLSAVVPDVAIEEKEVPHQTPGVIVQPKLWSKVGYELNHEPDAAIRSRRDLFRSTAFAVVYRPCMHASALRLGDDDVFLVGEMSLVYFVRSLLKHVAIITSPWLRLKVSLSNLGWNMRRRSAQKLRLGSAWQSPSRSLEQFEDYSGPTNLRVPTHTGLQRNLPPRFIRFFFVFLSSSPTLLEEESVALPPPPLPSLLRLRAG